MADKAETLVKEITKVLSSPQPIESRQRYGGLWVCGENCFAFSFHSSESAEKKAAECSMMALMEVHYSRPPSTA
jgi:hypothetical protein